MRIEKVAFENRLDKPLIVSIEPMVDTFDLPVGQRVEFHLHHHADDFDDPLEMVIHSDGYLVVYEQRQKLLEAYIGTELVYKGDADIVWRNFGKKPD